MRFTITAVLLFFLLIITLVLDVVFGSVHIPIETLWQAVFTPSKVSEEWVYILHEMRIPAAITASFVGAGLSLTGLQMQTVFRNPLADAGVLGVSSGAGLGIALFIMGDYLIGNIFELSASVRTSGMILFSIMGAALVLAIIATLSRRSRDITQVLIIGVMISFLTSSMVSLLQYFSPAELVKSFQVWSFGSLEGSSRRDTALLAFIVLPSMLVISCLPKALNALLLGDVYARSLGISTQAVKFTVIVFTGIIAGSITAFVGPIGFLGIAVPHVIRYLVGTTDHRKLIPLTILGGAVLMLFCHLISRLPQGGLVLPINIVTSLLGAPVVIAVLIGKKSSKVL